MFLTRTCTPLVTADVKCLTDIGFQQTSEFCDGNRYIYILIFIAKNLVPITLKFYAIAHLAL